jgi:hypothetical protein
MSPCISITGYTYSLHGHEIGYVRYGLSVFDVALCPVVSLVKPDAVKVIYSYTTILSLYYSEANLAMSLHSIHVPEQKGSSHHTKYLIAIMIRKNVNAVDRII